MNFDELKKSFNGGNALYVHGEPGWVTCDNQNRPVPKLSLFPTVTAVYPSDQDCIPVSENIAVLARPQPWPIDRLLASCY